jgi:hypothetical protein
MKKIKSIRYGPKTKKQRFISDFVMKKLDAQYGVPWREAPWMVDLWAAQAAARKAWKKRKETAGKKAAINTGRPRSDSGDNRVVSRPR